MAGVELKPMGRHAGPSTTSLPPPYTDDNKGASSPSAPPRDSAPGTLGSGYRTAAERARLEARHTEDGMDAVSVYGLVVAGWFGLLSIPLLILPRLILFLAQGSDPNTKQGPPLGVVNTPLLDRNRGQYDALTSLESYLARVLGFGLVSTAALIVFTVVPSYSPPSPARKPCVCVIAILTSIAAVVSWNAPLGALAIMLGLGNGIVGSWGWWSLFFGEDNHKFGKYLKENSRLKRL